MRKHSGWVGVPRVVRCRSSKRRDGRGVWQQNLAQQKERGTGAYSSYSLMDGLEMSTKRVMTVATVLGSLWE